MVDQALFVRSKWGPSTILLFPSPHPSSPTLLIRPPTPLGATIPALCLGLLPLYLAWDPSNKNILLWNPSTILPLPLFSHHLFLAFHASQKASLFCVPLYPRTDHLKSSKPPGNVNRGGEGFCDGVSAFWLLPALVVRMDPKEAWASWGKWRAA